MIVFGLVSTVPGGGGGGGGGLLRNRYLVQSLEGYLGKRVFV